MADWDYGGHYLRHDLTGTIEMPGGSKVAVCDWTEGMPEFMREADTLFIDPPWNTGNVKSFYTKADQPHLDLSFLEFSARLFQRIDEIEPQFLFLEMGKQHLAHYLIECQKRWKYVTFYNSTYYRKRTNKCYIIHACNEFRRRRYTVLEDMDEADSIAWITTNHEYQCIGDLCMGRGLVGQGAFRAGRRFVGTELNPKRLAVLVDWIAQRQALTAAQ